MDTKKGYTELGKTAAGKTIVAKLHPHNGMFFACFLEGGELPLELRGSFTSREVLKTKTIAYLSRMGQPPHMAIVEDMPEIKPLQEPEQVQKTAKAKAAKPTLRDDSKLETAEQRLNARLGMVAGVELLGTEAPVEFETATYTPKA